MAKKYPPYVNAYGNLSKLFNEIRKAAVPPKFNTDFMNSMLGLKSSSYRAMIPLLKNLGFLDQSNVPTKPYKEYRGEEKQAKVVMAHRVRESYSNLYAANEYAHKLSKKELTSKLRTLTGAGDKDKVIPYVVGTFTELCKLSDFEAKPSIPKEKEKENEGKKPKEKERIVSPLGISYTINLNLPATTEIEVFDAIFKSLKENILGE
ncbi:MAG: DUF5343 domain-containing protein [Sedimentisphaerales bacterium]